MKLLCWNCGGSLDDIPRPISRHSACSHCFNELHCCRLCRHYDPKRTMQCFEDRADPPLQKENANFCDFFTPNPNAFEVRTVSRSDNARDKLDALFGASSDQAQSHAQPGEEDKPANEDNSDETLSADEIARKKLDDLFN